MGGTHQRFYDYIQGKRARGEDLTWADQTMIRLLRAKRRWPEAPIPNEQCMAFMRMLREKDTLDLNIAESMMVATLIQGGLWPRDPAPQEHMDRLVEYLNSGPFEARNWWERVFGRVEPLLDLEAARWGYDMRGTGGPPAGVFPAEPFNGLQISYNVAGATLGAPTDEGGFLTRRTHQGVLTPGTLRVSGTVSVNAGFGADVTLRVWAGAEEQKLEFYLEKVEGGSRKAYDLSVPVPAGTQGGGFVIRMDGRYSMGGGWRGLEVAGTLAQSEEDRQAEREAADRAWREEVERTLRELGYEDTPAGKDLKEMREALAGGDAAWQAFVDRRQQELGYDQSPEAQQYYELRDAARAGGKTWDDYVAAHTGAGSTPGGQDSPDVGGLTVGRSVVDGQTQEVADHFPQASQVACATTFTDLPENTTAEAVWTLDGQETARSQRQVGGTGWVSFRLYTDDAAGLPPGRYQVTITAGDQVLGRKTFTIGEPPADG